MFAVQTAIAHASYDASDLDQWSFWVLPRSVVERTGQRRLQLSRVQALAGDPVPYGDLAAGVRSAAGVTPTPSKRAVPVTAQGTRRSRNRCVSASVEYR